MDDVSDYLVGSCGTFKAFLDELGRVAAAEIGVLIQGESGSGKGLAARALHALSARREGPLVEVPLAALAPTLIEAELFGHERGAFTGADRERSGRFRRAQGGTLVLDGIECLPEELQVKLLRALQERTIEPLGSEEVFAVDARVVATSTRDLAACVRAGSFREDLYYRLAVVTIEVPPLRARIEDLPTITSHLCASLSQRTGAAPRELSPEALARLAEHSWPGNVRELENALERVLVLVPGPARESQPGTASPGPSIEAAEFDFLAESVDGAAERVAALVLAHGLLLEEVEGAVLQCALSEQRGNLSAAARRVGLTRRAFEYRIAKLGESASFEEGKGDDLPEAHGEVG